MPIKILGAFFGDQTARRDVTASVKDKVSGGNLDVTANEELIPAFDVSEETRLDQSDINKIEKQAQEQCNGGADTACVQATKANLTRAKHEEKANTDYSSANIIAGRALTVNYVDESNRMRRMVVPDGQKLQLNDVEFTTKNGQSQPVAWEEYQTMFANGLGVAVWTAVFVFSVAASWRVFRMYGNIAIALFITVLAVLLPAAGAPAYIGIVFIIGIFAFLEMGRQSKQKALQQGQGQ
jgi:hypothetical protein